jgi:protein phosphatase
MSISAYAAASDTGRKRRRNEDSYVVAPPLFAVADGMGGAQAGEVASAIAANTLLEDARGSGAGGAAHVVELIQTANLRVYERAHEDATASGMGTTMTVARVEEGGMVVIGHVGDSRAYVLRDGTLEQLTDDHSLVAELVRRREISPDDAHEHPHRHVLTRAVGVRRAVDPDLAELTPAPGDVIVLCSDGLTTHVQDPEIAALVASEADLDEACARLVALANARGGEDNVTVALVRCDENEAQRAS